MNDVAICICSINKDGILEKCLDSLLSRTLYSNYQIYLCLDCDNRDFLLKYYKNYNKEIKYVYRGKKEEYSYSKFANRLVAACEEKFICLFNDDLEILTPNWLDTLIDYAKVSENGIITPKLLFPDGTIQHIGCRLDPEGICYHLHHHEIDDLTAEWNQPKYHITVSGACSLMRRDVYNQVGGYEEALTSYNDIDFALKIYTAGYWNICTPEAVLYHYESFTRGPEAEALVNDKIFMKYKWRNSLKLDEISN